MALFFREKSTLLIIAVSLISVLPFAVSLKYPFHYDDIPTIFEDTSTDSMSDILRIRLSERPIRKLSIIIDRQLFRDNVVYYRIENMLLYALCIALLGYLVGGMTGNIVYAVLAMAIFAFHPAHVENILIITHRKELFLMIFYVSALLAHIKGKNLLSLLLFIGALLSKEVAVTFPLVVYLYDRLFNIDRDKKYYYEILGILAAGIAAAVIFSSKTGFYLPSIEHMREFFRDNRMLRDADYLDIILIQPYLFAKYIFNMILPYNLNIDYTIPVNDYVSPVYFLSIITSGLFFILLYLFRKSRMFLFGMLFFLINYLPLSNVVPVLNLFADRYLFLPSAALLFILYPLYRRVKSGNMLMTAAAVLFLLLSLAYIPNFRSELSLWRYVIRKNPASVVGSNNYGLYLMKAGRADEAEKYMKEACSLDSLYTNAYINLGTLYASQKRYKEAENYFLRAAELESENVKALYNLSLVYMNTGRYEDAKGVLRRIILISPTSSLAFNNLGAAFYHDGLLSERLAKYILSMGAFSPGAVFLEDGVLSFLDASESFDRGLDIEKNFKKLRENKERVMGKINRELR